MAKENEDGAEKTEEPTARKLEKAASEGQVVRSPEVTVAACTILGFLALLLGGSYFAEQLVEVFKGGLYFCAGDSYGDLSGDLNGFSQSFIQTFLPDLQKRIQTTE